MKRKSKITHAMLVAEGIVDESPVDPRNKPVTATSAPAAADIVARPTPTNTAPKITDPKRKMPPTAMGLERAIRANIEAAGKPVHTTKSDYKPTGVFKAIA